MTKSYSFKSYDPTRFRGLVERLREILSGWEFQLGMHYGSTRKKGDEALATLTEASDVNMTTPTLHFVRADCEIALHFSRSGEVLEVHCRVKPPGVFSEERLHATVLEALNVSDATQDELDSTPSLYDVNQRVVKILRKIEAWEAESRRESNIGDKSCFVSFNFDERGLALAFELRDLFELLGVKFVSGFGYEPRSVSNKVLDRMRANNCLFIVIVTRSSGNEWLQQEIGVAKGLNLPVMVLMEEGVEFDLGILGDNEYVRFPKQTISKTFVSVIRALQFVGSNKV